MELKNPQTSLPTDISMAFANDFDGVFRFTNPTDVDFVFMWNNKEYTFPAQSTSPMIIPSEPLENVQEIRKRAAYKLAMREFYGHNPLYKKLVKQGGLYPSVPDEAVLQPMIDMCLKPLPIKKADVKEAKKEKVHLRGSKAIDDRKSVNMQFNEDETVESRVGVMPDSQI